MTAIQMLGFVRFAQSSVGMSADARISSPPIVGVPALARCVCGPSCRITCPIWNSRRRRISIGPSTRLSASAVTLAPAVRNTTTTSASTRGSRRTAARRRTASPACTTSRSATRRGPISRTRCGVCRPPSGRSRALVDHGTHEAIYLADPDRNDLELTWDRPPEEWPRTERGPFQDREFDLDGLLAEPEP